MAKIQPVRSYSDAEAICGQKSKVKIGHNTTVQVDAGYVASVRLHGKVIAVFHADGLTEFSNAGWPTVTTRDRLNQLLPHDLRVSQRHGVQYVQQIRFGEPNGVLLPYERSFTVGPDGLVITDEQVRSSDFE